jgi:hypothetical protein
VLDSCSCNPAVASYCLNLFAAMPNGHDVHMSLHCLRLLHGWIRDIFRVNTSTCVLRSLR